MSPDINMQALRKGVAEYYGLPEKEAWEKAIYESLADSICPCFDKQTGEYVQDGEPDLNTVELISSGEFVFL